MGPANFLFIFIQGEYFSIFLSCYAIHELLLPSYPALVGGDVQYRAKFCV